MLDASLCASGAKQRAGQETGNKEETIPILTKGKQFNGAYFLKPCNLYNCFKRCCFDFLFLRGLPQKTQQSLKNDDRDCHIVNLSIVAFSKKNIGLQFMVQMCIALYIFNTCF